MSETTRRAKRYLSAQDLVDMGLGKLTFMYQLMHTKGFPAVKLGRVLRVEEQDLYNWLEKQKVNM